jgi:hypothetical protein
MVVARDESYQRYYRTVSRWRTRKNPFCPSKNLIHPISFVRLRASR